MEDPISQLAPQGGWTAFVVQTLVALVIAKVIDGAWPAAGRLIAPACRVVVMCHGVAIALAITYCAIYLPAGFAIGPVHMDALADRVLLPLVIAGGSLICAWAVALYGSRLANVTVAIVLSCFAAWIAYKTPSLSRPVEILVWFGLWVYAYFAWGLIFLLFLAFSYRIARNFANAQQRLGIV